MKVSAAILTSLTVITQIAHAQGTVPVKSEPVVPAVLTLVKEIQLPKDSGGVGAAVFGTGGRLALGIGGAGATNYNNMAAAVLAVYDSALTTFKTAGRGSGAPGEIGRIASIEWRGDSVLVTEGQVPRVVVFTNEAKYLGLISLNGRPPSSGQIGMTATGQPVLHTWMQYNQRNPRTIDTMTVLVMVDGSPRTIAVRERSTAILGITVGRGFLQSTQPAANAPAFTFAKREDLVLVATPGVASANGIAPMLFEWINLKGDVVSSRQFDAPVVLNDQAARSKWIEQMILGYKSAMERYEASPDSVRTQLTASLIIPQYAPVLGFPMHDRGGGIWFVLKGEAGASRLCRLNRTVGPINCAPLPTGATLAAVDFGNRVVLRVPRADKSIALMEYRFTPQ